MLAVRYQPGAHTIDTAALMALDYEGFGGFVDPIDWMLVADFYVEGRVAPKGSKSAFRNKKTGQINQVEASRYVKSWQKSVVEQTPDFARKRWAQEVKVDVDFYLERGKTVKRRFPTKDPDGDKLLRCTFDGLQQAGVVADDNVIIDGHFREFYAPQHLPPGAHIRVSIERWGE